MAKYFIQDTTLTNIADAIRAKTGGTDSITPENMPTEIASITTGTATSLKPAEYPDYVRKEINRVADEARKVITDESLVSICLSDSHYPASENTRKSGLHAMMAIKGLTYLLPVDFIAHLGDVGYEGSSSTETTTDRLEANLVEMLGYIKESSGDSVPLFVAIGNHDPGNYITTDDDTDMISGEYLYNNFTALSASDNTVFSGETTGGYCYRDFTDKKIRVFMLNSAENIIIGGYDNDSGCSATQLAWFASMLQDLNTKSDAASWGIVVLCHYPADYGAARPLSNTIAAYVNGTSITLNGTTYNFSGANSARFIVQHHGHIHNFLADKLYTGSTPTQYNAWRVGIPNTQDSRENYYGEFNGIQYSESTNYTKVPDTVEDTSFVVNVINPSEEKIYSFYYGKGRNRTIGYGGVTYYSIMTNLTNVTTTSNIVSVAEGDSYNATMTVNEGCSLSTVVVTMGGTDITSDVYADGVINIETVTGDIVITMEATARPNFTNLVPTSTDSDGVTIYNETGYKAGAYIDSNGDVQTSGWSMYVATGFIEIPVADSRTIRIAGDGIIFDGSDTYQRIAFYDANYTKLGYVFALVNGDSNNYGTIIEEDNTEFTMTFTYSAFKTAQYIRVGCMTSTPENLIITVDEEVTYGGETATSYRVSNNLVNATNSNDATSVSANGTYSAALTIADGCNVETLTITMGGTDITSTVYSNGSIYIPSVTGDIEITVLAIEESYFTITNNLTNVTTSNSATQALEGTEYTATLTADNGYVIDEDSVSVTIGGVAMTPLVYADGVITLDVTGDVVITASATRAAYTNWIPLSTATIGGTEIYNGVGYKTGTRINSSYAEVSATNMCCTGYIPVKVGDVLRFKNITISGGSTAYGLIYTSSGGQGGSISQNTMSSSTTDGITTVTVPGTSTAQLYFRLSVGVINDTSIITINEEITE